MASDATPEPPGESTRNMTHFVSLSFIISRKLFMNWIAVASLIVPIILTTAIFSPVFFSPLLSVKSDYKDGKSKHMARMVNMKWVWHYISKHKEKTV